MDTDADPVESSVAAQASAAARASAASGDQEARRPEADVSVAGVLVLSAMSVGAAILIAVVGGLAVLGVWWLLSHVPLPAFVVRWLAAIGLR